MTRLKAALEVLRRFWIITQVHRCKQTISRNLGSEPARLCQNKYIHPILEGCQDTPKHTSSVVHMPKWTDVGSTWELPRLRALPRCPCDIYGNRTGHLVRLHGSPGQQDP